MVGPLSSPMVAGRLLAVHAHPDDETLATGGTLARYAAAGAQVTLVTCTLGQAGEVIPDDLRHLSGDRLGEHRAVELDRAAHELGIEDHRLLGSGRWVDSGMVWLAPGIAGPAPDAGPDAFALASIDEAARLLADVVREIRPHVVVTYDPEGGYGHPDHVQAHRVTTAAVLLAAQPGPDSGPVAAQSGPVTAQPGPDAGQPGPDAGQAGPDPGQPGSGRPGWVVPRVVWPRVTWSWAMAERTRAQHGRPVWATAREMHAPFPPVVVDDDLVDVAVDVRAVMDRTEAALRAHATQVRVDGDWFALSDGVAQLRRHTEWYELADSHRPSGASRGDRSDAVEAERSPVMDDVFHGLDLSR